MKKESHSLCSNNNNNEINKLQCINTLIHYYKRNLHNPRTVTSVRINPKIFQNFRETCRKLNLLTSRGNVNVALESLMQMIIDQYGNEPVIQTTLFPELEQPKIVELNIAQKLELNMVKKDLGYLIDALENRRGHPDFLEGKLRETLPKAIRVYEDTRDSELELLLAKVEKFV